MGRLLVLKPNYQAEMSVIGAIILDPKKVMPLAALKLKPEDFKTSELRTIYSACLKLFRADKPVDHVTVQSIIGDEYQPTILAAADTMPHYSNASAYIDAVKERSQKMAAYDRAIAGDATTDEQKSAAVIERMDQIVCHLDIPKKLDELGIHDVPVDELAHAGMKVTRLLVNNMREVTYEDAKAIYQQVM